MTNALCLTLWCATALGLALVTLQGLALRRHLRRAPRAPRGAPPAVSVLKPLCGVDDRLEENLASFAALDHPSFEVLLGLRSARDPASRIALAAARRWPDRFRVVLQRGEPGLNPKVNQLVTMAAAARHDVLVVSDSNVQVEPGYLTEIVALLEDERVGLVTHPVVGSCGGLATAGLGGARARASAGATLDHLHMAGAITPGVIAAQALTGQPIVVGKSMALRRRDLQALGGFEAVKDVLAEDFVMGRRVGEVLGKRVAVARRPIRDVSVRRTVSAFAARYRRWGVMQRQAAGPLAYASLALLNPLLLATAAAAVGRSASGLALLAGACAAKIALDGAAGRALRPGGFGLRALMLVPAKDLLVGAAWAHGLFQREVRWRGSRLRVLPGTRLEVVGGEDSAAPSPDRHRAATRAA